MDLKIKKIKVGDYRTNCYIVSSKSGATFVVDPGAEPEKIIDELEKIDNLNFKFILLTHAHFDHVLAVDELKQKYPKVDIYLNELDVKLVNEVPEQGLFCHRLLHNFHSPVIATKDGDEINFEEFLIKVISTPGHTPGGTCFLIDNMLFSGDTIFYHTYGRTDLPFSDEGKMKESLAKILKMPKTTKIFPGHGQNTSVEEENRLSCFYLSR